MDRKQRQKGDDIHNYCVCATGLQNVACQILNFCEPYPET